MKFWMFALGTAVGSVPKIALTAFAGAQVVNGLNGGGWTKWATLVVTAAIWIASALWARAWLKKREAARIRGVGKPEPTP